MIRTFADLVERRWKAGLNICVGLDPEPSRLPADTDIETFHRQIISATCDLAAAYKPNIAFYEALGEYGMRSLQATMELIRALAPEVPVIIDAKRADIGNTNRKYATAIFDALEADAITVHPYLGPEAMMPFLERADKGIIVLCRTSNPGAGRYQDLLVEQRPLYQHIAQDVAEMWNANGNCGLVVGATYPEELGNVRRIVGDLPILVPGIGAQGGDVEATVANGLDSRGWGLLLHSGRSLIYAFEDRGEPVEKATRDQIESLHAQITAARPK